MREVDSIHHFEDTPIWAAWDAELEEWFFSILDVVAALTGSTDPKQYIIYGSENDEFGWNVIFSQETNTYKKFCTENFVKDFLLSYDRPDIIR